MDHTPTERRFPFRIKVCGLTNPADVHAAVRCGADGLGYNFYSRSLRHITADDAVRLRQSVGDDVYHVGVFVNHAAEEILRTVEWCRLHAVQLHGDERPEWVKQLAPWPVIRAIRLARHASITALQQEVQDWEAAGASAVLLDAPSAPGVYGGTGQVADWELASTVRQACSVPLILAGGLTAENVAAGIQLVRPDAVDVASGVEDFPGKKSVNAMTAFVNEARRGWSAVKRSD